MTPLYGGVEAGGTKIVCAVGTGPDDFRDEVRFPTTGPDKTINSVIEYFQRQNAKQRLMAIGIGAFGPLDLQRNSPTYGHITTTPKSSWTNTDFVGPIKRAFDVPVGFDTDVNAAALGEHRWGAAQNLNNFIYLTIGTGIGGGGMVNGQLLHGLAHPEMGHIFIRHDVKTDPYTGRCPFHNDCFEGLASGLAIRDRWGVVAEALGSDHEAWELEAHYVSLALVNYICTLSPQRIIIGGGVMEQESLFPLVRDKTKDLLGDYIQAGEIVEDIDNYVVPPSLGNQAGILEAIALAEQEYIKDL